MKIPTPSLSATIQFWPGLSPPWASLIGNDTPALEMKFRGFSQKLQQWHWYTYLIAFFSENANNTGNCYKYFETAMKVNRNEFQCLYYRTANQPQQKFQGWKQCDSYKPKKCQKISGKKRLVVCTFGRLQGQKNLPNSPKTIYSHLENCTKFLEPRFPLFANVINESFLIEIT